jgi:curved DNA-binding protein CbpA
MGNQPSQPQPVKKLVKVPQKNIPSRPVQQQLSRPPQPPAPQQVVAQPSRFVQPPSKTVAYLMPRPQATKGGISQANIMNVNQRIKEFKNTQQTDEQQFLENLEKQKQQFYQQKKSKEDQFQSELQDFEQKYNPFRILHLDYNATEDDVKKAYKKFSLKYHPDRQTGNSKKFMMVSQAYVYLMQKIKEMQGNNNHNELRENAKQYFEDMDKQRQVQQQSGVAPKDRMEIGEKNFDPDKFNKIFEQNRMPTQYDRGYGDGWEDDTHEENVVMNQKFTLDLFNNTFDGVKQKKMDKMKEMQIMKVDGPQPQILSNLGFEELGGGDINDFTSSPQENMAFTDYKAAYTRANVLEYDESYKRQEYKNLDSLVRARDTQNFAVTDDDRKWMNQQDMYEKEKEQKRIENMMSFDRMAEVYSQRANQHFIKN